MAYPVSVGQELVLDCLRSGDPGEAVALCEGLTVLVAGALPGERVLARITQCAPNYARGRALKVLAPSPSRVQPLCPLYAQCGGCVLQHMDTKAQLAAKEEKVVQSLRRLGGFAPGSYRLDPIVSASDPWRYRNKAVFACALMNGKPSLGLYEPESHALVPSTDCLLQSETVCTAAAAVEKWLRVYAIQPYDGKQHKGLFRHLMLRVNTDGELLAVPIVCASALPHADALVEALRAAVPSLAGVVVNYNTKRQAPILSGPCETLYGRDYLEETLSGLRFRISPLSFFQVNPEQTVRLYGSALEFASLTRDDIALDAYCGTGTIALMMARSAARVVGVELYAPAVESARESAKRNGIQNADFYAGACEQVLPRLIENGLRFDVCTVDPPRKGCDKALLQALVKAAPRRIVYVSCNPATLSRDLKLLCAQGYRLERVRPVDMFPQTASIECAVLLTRTASSGC